MPLGRRMLVHALSVLSLLLSFAAAPASGPSFDAGVTESAPSPAMSLQLKLFAERSRATRLSIVATSAVTGVVMVATGIVLDGRPDDVSQSVGIGLVAGGAAPLLFSALLLKRAGVEKVSADFEAATASGRDAAIVRRATLDEWRRAADTGHRQRTIAGTVEVALGAGATAAGMYLLLAQAGVGGMTRNGQYQVASFLIGPGVPIFTLGVRSLQVDSLEETSWRAYGAPAQACPTPVSVGMVPTRGGVVTALRAALW